LYDRTNPTRTLLGEEQYSWLAQRLRTEAAPLVCITGINGLHTIWSGIQVDAKTGLLFDERDRVTADYAGWVKAGSDRVLELLGARPGITSVYGDVHNGCIMTNKQHRIVEGCFGPIGRGSGRAPKEDFGPDMLDYDGRPLRMHALYHADYETPALRAREGPFYWNFMEMQFDTNLDRPVTVLALRNVVDPPDAPPRGGEALRIEASETGRPASSVVPETTLLPDADVQFSLLTGDPVRATRTRTDGTIPLTRFPDIEPDTPLLATAYTHDQALSVILQTLPDSNR
jgi:hypothetical protein